MLRSIVSNESTRRGIAELGARILISRGVPAFEDNSMGKAAGELSASRVGWMR